MEIIFLLNLFLLSFSFYLIYLSYLKRSVGIILWTGLTVFYALPQFVEILADNLSYPLWVYTEATIFSLFFAFFYLASFVLIPRFKVLSPKFLRLELRYKQENILILVMFFCLCLSIACLLIGVYSVFGSLSSFSWVDVFEIRSSPFLIASSYLWLVSSPIFFFAVVRKRFLLALVAFSLILVAIFVFRVRAFLLPLFVPLILYYLIFDSSQKRISLIRLFGIMFFSSFLLFAILGIAALRVVGSYDSLTDFQQVFVIILDLFSSPSSEFGLRNAFYLFIEKHNNFEGFGQGLGYLRLFLLPIPSSLSLGIKPFDFASYMALAYDPSSSVLGVNSMHPTIYGDSFANFGFFGFISSVFWAFIVRLFDHIISSPARNIYSASLFVIICSGLVLVTRGAVYNGIVNVYIVFIGCWLVSRLMLFLYPGIYRAH